MSTIGIIFLCIGVLMLGLFSSLYIWEGSGLYLIGFLVGCAVMFGSIILFCPTHRDVRQGKAYYVETQRISVQGDDTIRFSTYEIKWKEK